MNERGYALPTVLIIITFLFAIATIILASTRFVFVETTDYHDHQRSLLLAKSSFEMAVAEISHNPDYSGSGGWVSEQSDAIYWIEVKKVTDSKRKVETKGKVGGYEKGFSGEIEIDVLTGKIVAKKYWLK